MTLQDWLRDRPFSLALSSGFFGFYAHCGFIKALHEADCHPQEVSGSSAGAIIAGALASGLSPRDIENLILKFQKKDFWDPGFGWGLVRGELFEKILSDHFIADFQQARMPLHVTVFDILKLKTEVAREGSAAKAIRASCAVPGMFHPTVINRRPFWDGGIFDKAGDLGLAHSEFVLCHYLKPAGIWGRLEYQNYLRKKKVHTKVIVSENLPLAGPDHMHRGPEILELAYQKTKENLQRPLSLV